MFMDNDRGEVRGKVALLLVFALVAGTTFTAGLVGPTFGYDVSTGQQGAVDNASSELADSEDDVSGADGFNPVASLQLLASAFNILANTDSSLTNVLVPDTVAGYLATGVPLVIGLAVVQIALRQRL
jgi:hypothetical protein